MYNKVEILNASGKKAEKTPLPLIVDYLMYIFPSYKGIHHPVYILFPASI